MATEKTEWENNNKKKPIIVADLSELGKNINCHLLLKGSTSYKQG